MLGIYRTVMHIDGVGTFAPGPGRWEAEPCALAGSSLSIESAVITPEAQERAKAICENWPTILEVCRQFVEGTRSKYQLQARQFSNPNIFIESGSAWSVYFDTEVELEAVVGVEFRGNEPFQLIIGD